MSPKALIEASNNNVNYNILTVATKEKHNM